LCCELREKSSFRMPPQSTSQVQLTHAYAACRAVARSAAKNFYYSFLALPQEKRNALCAVYAFMRHADDLSDDPSLAGSETRLAKLDAWLQQALRTCDGATTDDAVLMALADTQQRFKIPVALFEKLVRGTAMDAKVPSPAVAGPSDPLVLYRTFAELYDYCYHVASVVGLVCIRIFGYHDAAAEALAEQCGVAFQLTNILRDVKEDAGLGRIYVPAEDMERFGVSARQLAGCNSGNGFQPVSLKPLFKFEAQRAREFYAAGEKLIPLIDADSRPALWVLLEIYQRLLKRITERDYDVFSERVTLGTPEKLWVLSRGLLRRLAQ